MKLIQKIKSNLVEIFLTITIFFVLNYIFRFDFYNLTLIIISSVLYYLLQRFSLHKIRNNLFAIISIVFIGYVFFESPVTIISILLGLNLSFLFIQIRNIQIKTLDLSLANTIALTTILLSSGIEKFRGVNKIDDFDIQITIPTLVFSSFTIYIISAYLKQYWQKSFIKNIKKTILMNYFLYTIIGGVILFVFYNESGADYMLVPFLVGVLSSFSKYFITQRTVLNDILDIILLIMFPFQIAGYTGIGVAIMSMYLAEYFINFKISSISSSNSLRLAQFYPLLFLFAAQEIRENEGLINRLDITNGYQISWILIALILVRFIGDNIIYFKKILIKNELVKIIPQIVIICILVGFAIIIRSGRFEGAVAIVTAFSGYMFIATSSYSESHISKPVLRFLNSSAGLIGAMSFLVLTTF